MQPPELGSVTLLFTDIEDSTRLLHELGGEYQQALTTHHNLLGEAVRRGGGRVFGSAGDALFCMFDDAEDALSAAVEAQRALAGYRTADGRMLSVRMGIHTGPVTLAPTGYVGLALHQVARVASAAHGGQVLVSGATEEALAGATSPEITLLDLGLHRLKDLLGPQRLFQVCHPELPGQFPPPRSLDRYHHNLPAQLTNFIGCEDQIADLRQILDRSRLVTLVGTGGSGKTRLALQVAAETVERYKDGVWLVELSPIVAPALVPGALAAAVGVRRPAGTAEADDVVQHLRDRSSLLLLDNCEQVAEAVAVLVDLILRQCQGVAVLATSQLPLRLTGETVWRVRSLTVPGPAAEAPPLELPVQGRMTPDDQMAFESIRLFVDRADAMRPGFMLTAGNVQAVAQICRRLDGIPLAIELAAARVRALTPRQIAARLDDRFRLLAGGDRTALPRRATLRGALQWSYELLAAAERSVFNRISVFPGGCTLAAAEAVAAAPDVPVEDVLDALTGLVDKSLLIADDRGDECRYLMLESMREYGSERLAETGEASYVQQRLVRWSIDLVESLHDELVGPQLTSALEVLDPELDNLRSALTTSLSSEPELAARLACAILRFFAVRHPAEGRTWMHRILVFEDQLSPRARVETILACADLAFRQAAYAETIQMTERAVALSRQHNIDDNEASALRLMGAAALELGENGRAADLARRVLDTARSSGNEMMVATALNSLGRVALARGQYREAQQHLGESLAAARRLGDTRGVAYACGNLGRVHAGVGDYGSAVTLLDECLRLSNETGDPLSVALGLLYKGRVALARGLADTALAHFRESLSIADREGGRWVAMLALESAGNALAQQGDSSSAAQHLRDSYALAREIGVRRGMAVALAGLSATMLASGDLHGAEQTASDALKTAEELGDVAITIAALITTGRVNFVDGRATTGLASLIRALSLAESTDALPDQAEVLIELGERGHEAAGWEAAERYCDRGLQLSRRIGAGALTARGLLARSRLAVLRQDEAGAERWLRQALGAARIVPSHVVAAECVIEAALLAERRPGQSFDQLHREAVLFGWFEARRHPDEVPFGHCQWQPLGAALGRLEATVGPTRFAQAVATGRTITIESAVAEALLLVSG
jgi:predicted ATPase/class 3 adenylate cyclase